MKSPVNNHNWKTLRTIVESQVNGQDHYLAVIRKDGMILSVNQNFARTLELERPSAGKYNFFQLAHPFYVLEIGKALEISREKNIPCTIELSMKNGYYHPIKWQVNALPATMDDDIFLCIGHKLLDQKRAIRFSELSRKNYQMIMDGLDQAIMFHDVEGEVIAANHKTAELFVSSLEEIYSVRNVREQWNVYFTVTDELGNLVHFDEAPFRKAAVTGVPQSRTMKVRLPNGGEKWIHYQCQPLFDEQGRNAHAVMTSFTSVTDQKKLSETLQEREALIQKKLREANDRIMLLTRATTDAIWEWDMQTGNIFRNDALMDMIGYQPDLSKGLSWWLRRIHPEDRNRIGDVVRETTEQGKQSWEDEYRFKCADGVYRIMRDKGFIVYENGLPVKMIGSLQDVTDLRELEDKLDNEKLRRQKEISETVIRVQEKERTRIGHELHDNVNQILSTTKLFVDMLETTNPEQQQLKEKSLSYILLAIEEIRKLSRELVVPRIREKGLVESVQSLIADIRLSTAIKIRLTNDHDTDLLSADIRLTLFRIIQEALKNVVNHSRATEVDICLKYRNGEIQLLVRDNGIGFDASRVNGGIGFSNIQERARFYNGTADIETAPGKGCTIDVRIPVAGQIGQ